MAGADRLRASLTDGRSLDAEMAGNDPAADTAVLRFAAARPPHSAVRRR